MEAGHHVRAALGGDLQGVLAGFLEVFAVLYQRNAQGTHGGVFSTELPRGTTMVQATPWRRAAQPMLWPWLPRVALTTSRGNAPRWARALVEVGQAAPDLEGAHGRGFSCHEPAVGAQAFAQQCPAVLRCGGKSRYTTWAAASISARVGRVWSMANRFKGM